MNKPIIAVDADDTIFDEQTAVMKFHNAKYDTEHTLEDYLAPADYNSSWETVWDVDETEADRRYEEFIEYKLIHNIPPMDDAFEVLTKLKKIYDLVIVTARDERGVKITHEALNEHFPTLFSDVHFVPLWGGNRVATKAEICNEIGATYLIDDNFEHCSLAAESGITALLFGQYGWNVSQQLPKNMTKVKDWIAVQTYFEKVQA